jgi:hypothetical protein
MDGDRRKGRARKGNGEKRRRGNDGREGEGEERVKTKCPPIFAKFTPMTTFNAVSPSE